MLPWAGPGLKEGNPVYRARDSLLIGNAMMLGSTHGPIPRVPHRFHGLDVPGVKVALGHCEGGARVQSPCASCSF